MEEIKVNEKAVERLKRKIILQESQNLKTREKTDQQMVAWIKNQIEEEVHCCSNQYNLRIFGNFAMSPLTLLKDKTGKMLPSLLVRMAQARLHLRKLFSGVCMGKLSFLTKICLIKWSQMI